MSKDLTDNLLNEENKAPTTNPMLEAILAKVTEAVERVINLEAKVNSLEIKVDDGFTKVNSRLDKIE